jgi:hypothetical protein
MPNSDPCLLSDCESVLAQVYRKLKMGYGKFNNSKLMTKHKSSEFRNYGMIVESFLKSVIFSG